MNSQNTLNESQNLILHPTRLKMLLGLVGSLAFVAVGLWMASSGNILLISIGIISISFFGLCSLIFLVSFIHPFSVLVVSEEGFQQRSPLYNVFVAWEEIAAITVFKGRYTSLNIYLSESGKETFSARYPRSWRISRLFGGMPALSFSQLFLPVPAQTVSEVLQESYQRQIEKYDILIR